MDGWTFVFPSSSNILIIMIIIIISSSGGGGGVSVSIITTFPGRQRKVKKQRRS